MRPLSVLLSLPLVIMMSGCVRPAKPYLDKGNLLSSVGFVAHPANTTARYGLMNILPPGELTYRMGIDGKPVYLYADPIACGCVYMGDSDSFNRLKGMNSDIKHKQNNLLDTNFNRMTYENNRNSAQWDWTIWAPSADPDNNQPKHMIGNYW